MILLSMHNITGLGKLEGWAEISFSLGVDVFYFELVGL